MWVTLTERKTSVLAHHNDVAQQEITNSRSTRSIHRNSTYEQSVIKRNRTADLKTIKEPYDLLKKDRPDVDSEEYNEWYMEYQDAREEYEHQKTQIMEKKHISSSGIGKNIDISVLLIVCHFHSSDE